MTKALTRKQTENAHLISILTSIGLSDAEAQVYLAALSLGPTTVLRLSRATDIKRTTLYTVIESLKQKGLFKIEIKGFKRFFVAEHPENLSLVLEKRANDFNNFVPLLASLYNQQAGEASITYHEGIEAIKVVYENLLKGVGRNDPYLAISTEEFFEPDRPYFERFIERRAQKYRDVRLILLDEKMAREHKKFERNFNERIRFLPAGTQMDINVVITKDTLVLHQLKTPIHALVIKTRTIIESHKNIFEVLWKRLA
ncbi:MAG: helix-turn-helix domain-containing protein [Patescibacteria group bacterium]